MVCVAFIVTNTAICFASDGLESYDITSLKELDETIEEFGEEGISKSDGEWIIEETAPEVMADYIENIDKAAAEYFEEAEPDEVLYDSDNDCSTLVYRTEIDSLSSVELVLSDREETSLLENTGKTVKSLFIDECYAATNGDTLWKKYGKRYYTAKYTRNIGPGYATICTENHYTISKNGIHERKAISWLDSMASVTGDMTKSGYSVFPDAKKAGETTGIRARISFKYTASAGGGALNTYVTIYEKLNIKYVKNDTKNKKMKVKYTWSKTKV